MSCCYLLSSSLVSLFYFFFLNFRNPSIVSFILCSFVLILTCPLYHRIHLTSAHYPSSLRPPLSSSLHPSIHAPPHLSSLKTASAVQWGLSSAPLQRPLWFSPPLVLSPPFSLSSHLFPTGGCMEEKILDQSRTNNVVWTHLSWDGFHVFGRLSQWWWFFGVPRFMFEIVAANRGQHCTTAKKRVIPVVVLVSWGWCISRSIKMTRNECMNDNKSSELLYDSGQRSLLWLLY